MIFLAKWLIESLLEYGIVWQIIDIGLILLIIFIVYKIFQFKNKITKK